MDGLECIDIHKAKEIMDQGQATIVDVRDMDSFEEAQIEKAVFLTDQTVENFIKQANKEQPLICYCYHGNNSQMAATFFLENGFQKVYSINGGFEAWRQEYPSANGSS